MSPSVLIALLYQGAFAAAAFLTSSFDAASTPASLMKNQIPEKVKEERLAILQASLLRHQKAFNKKFTGQTLEVLLTEKGKQNGQLNGYSPYLQNVHVSLDELYLGEIVKVKILSATASSLSGEKV